MANGVFQIKVWHGEYAGSGRIYADREARALVDRVRGNVEAKGGQIAVSKRFGLGPTVIVLILPANLNPEQFIPATQVVFVDMHPDTRPSAPPTPVRGPETAGVPTEFEVVETEEEEEG